MGKHRVAIFAMILLWLLCFCYFIAMLRCVSAMNCYDCVMFRIACCYEKEAFGKQIVPDGVKSCLNTMRAWMPIVRSSRI